jgi:hypothetical protein
MTNDDLYRFEFSKSFLSYSVQLLTLHQQSIMNNSSLPSLHLFNETIFRYFSFEIYNQLEENNFIDLAKLFADLIFLSHSIVFHYFDTTASFDRREVYYYSHMDDCLMFFHRNQNFSICQRFFELIFKK